MKSLSLAICFFQLFESKLYVQAFFLAMERIPLWISSHVLVYRERRRCVLVPTTNSFNVTQQLAIIARIFFYKPSTISSHCLEKGPGNETMITALRLHFNVRLWHRNDILIANTNLLGDAKGTAFDWNFPTFRNVFSGFSRKI